MMKTIIFRPFFHRGEEKLGIVFGNDVIINDIAKRVQGVKWSCTHKCWYVPLNKDACASAYQSLKPVGLIHLDELRMYLIRKKRAKAGSSEPQSGLKKMRSFPVLSKVSKGNLEQLEIFVQQLKLKAYSESTIRTYRSEFLQLLQLLNSKPVHELKPDDLKRYMVHAMEKQGINEHTAHSRLNALKFYFEQVLGREKFFWEIPRPKKPQLLPKLLNEDEIARLFNALRNKKHKAMLFTVYSAGLRVSELANLKIADIDGKRMQILISQAKGKKDRYVNLSPLLLDVLRSYIATHKPKPRTYLFESDYTQTPYPIRTIQRYSCGPNTTPA